MRNTQLVFCFSVRACVIWIKITLQIGSLFALSHDISYHVLTEVSPLFSPFFPGSIKGTPKSDKDNTVTGSTWSHCVCLARRELQLRPEEGDSTARSLRHQSISEHGRGKCVRMMCERDRTHCQPVCQPICQPVCLSPVFPSVQLNVVARRTQHRSESVSRHAGHVLCFRLVLLQNKISWWKIQDVCHSGCTSTLV